MIDFENTGEYMLPARVRIYLSDKNCFELPVAFTSEGEALYSILTTGVDQKNETIEVSDQMLFDALEIETADSCGLFLKKYPGLKFFPNNYVVSEIGLVSKIAYYEQMCEIAKRLRGICKLLILQNKYSEITKSIDATLFIENIVFDDDAKSVVGDILANDLKEYVDLQGAEPPIRSKYNYETSLSAAYDAINTLNLEIEAELNTEPDVSLNIKEELLCYSFNNVYSALLMYLFLSIMNGTEYRQCSHVNCNIFFTVDQHHPQSMCDKHMAARRRARKNQKGKNKKADFELPF